MRVLHKRKNYVKLYIHSDQEQTVKNLYELELEIHHFRSASGISSVKGGWVTCVACRIQKRFLKSS